MGTRSPEERFTRSRGRGAERARPQPGAAAHAMRLAADLQHARARLRRSVARRSGGGCGATCTTGSARRWPGSTMQMGAARYPDDRPRRRPRRRSSGPRWAAGRCIARGPPRRVRAAAAGPGRTGPGGARSRRRRSGSPAADPGAEGDHGRRWTASSNGLPAAAEVAALRIGVEALTNGIRHAGQRRPGKPATERPPGYSPR